MGSIYTAFGTSSIAAADGYIYATVTGVLRIISVSDPASPRLVSSYPNVPIGASGGAKAVSVADGLAYVVGEAGLEVLDVSDPVRPVRVGLYQTSGLPEVVTTNGPHAFVAGGADGLLVFRFTGSGPGPRATPTPRATPPVVGPGDVGIRYTVAAGVGLDLFWIAGRSETGYVVLRFGAGRERELRAGRVSGRLG